MAGKSGIRSRSARRFSFEHLGHMNCAAGGSTVSSSAYPISSRAICLHSGDRNRPRERRPEFSRRSFIIMVEPYRSPCALNSTPIIDRLRSTLPRFCRVKTAPSAHTDQPRQPPETQNRSKVRFQGLFRVKVAERMGFEPTIPFWGIPI